MNYLLKNFLAVNEGKQFKGQLLISNGLIYKILKEAEPLPEDFKHYKTLDLNGNLLIPGAIDDQVHFRDPGLTHKGDLYTESRAAVAGGVTTFMDMPNTLPACTTLDLLEQKYSLAATKSFANYSFFLGASNNNIEEIKKVNPKTVCGVKAFLGSSTGNLLVNDPAALETLFAESPILLAAHCEDDSVISQNADYYRKRYGENISVQFHSRIRNDEACYRSSSKAVALAKKHGTRFHLIHVSTARELELLDNHVPVSEKMITSEVCVHHLWFNESDYQKKGNLIKWNPSIKSEQDRQALFQGVLNGKLDMIATDHAPHTLEEKAQPYFKAPSGAPMVQHSLITMLEFYHRGLITLELMGEKMCHMPALVFNIDRRGYIREGYHADLVVVDLESPWKLTQESILYKCKWSPLEGMNFRSEVLMTFINGHLVYEEGIFEENPNGDRILFNR